MGFGEVAAATIMFVTVLSAATLLAFMFNNYASSATSTINTRQQFVNEQLKTSIDIEHVLYDYTTDHAEIFIRNTGESSMQIDEISGFLAGERLVFNSSGASIQVVPDTDTTNTGIWDPKEIVRINVTQSITPDTTHQAIIITPYSVRDEYDFSV